MIDNKLIINCTNVTNNYCWKDLFNGEILIDIEAYDYGKPELSSRIKLRLYRGTSRPLFIKYEYLIIGIGSLLGILFILSTIFICICCRRKQSNKGKEYH